MKLKHWIRYLVTHDTTWHGQFPALRRLLLGTKGIEHFVVDVGANDGFYSSNSYPFIRRGWNAVLIEPNPHAFLKASQLHSGNKKVSVLNFACSDQRGCMPLILFKGDEGGSHSMLSTRDRHLHTECTISEEITVRVETLEEILDGQHVPLAFGLLSVDSEGHDYQIIHGLNLSRFRPRVIITENCSNKEDKFSHLMKHGYELYETLEFDTIWTNAQ